MVEREKVIRGLVMNDFIHSWDTGKMWGLDKNDLEGLTIDHR